jgi:flagellar hook-associated protein 1 FlgK
MSLSSAFNIISSSFVANSAQTALISANIANANTTGYSTKTANLATTSYGGVDVASISRSADSALLDQVLQSTSQSASQQAVSNGLKTLAQTVSDSSSSSSSSGASKDGQSPSAMLSNLQTALATYQSSPSSASAADAVVTAAENLASSLNTGAQTVQQVREQADSDMATAVNTINSLLSQFQQVNATIVNGLANGADVTDAEDTRDQILTQLSQQIGIATVTNSDGSTSIYTDSGATLFQGGVAQTLTFQPSATLTAGASGNQVYAGGVPITGASSPMAIQSGSLAGYAALRDTIAPEYQAQLDQIANGLISAFAETPQSTSSGGATPPSSLPGLFTYQGATGMPTSATGLSGLIEVNPNVDPAQGGNVNLLRDGGISDPNDAYPSTTAGESVYTYNTTGAASYTRRIQQLISGITATQSFSASAGLGSSDSLSDYANASVSWLQGQNQQASDQATYQSSLATTATGALSNATGVNLDAEMTNMLNLENTYTTSAKLLNTVTDMFNSLLAAIPNTVP